MPIARNDIQSAYKQLHHLAPYDAHISLSLSTICQMLDHPLEFRISGKSETLIEEIRLVLERQKKESQQLAEAMNLWSEKQ